MEKNITLDNAQIKILESMQNTLVIAGAGTGKTTTIIGKINYLIENQNINPQDILVISFTNASTNDIKSKLKYDVNVFTFHKLAIDILDKAKFSYTLCKPNILTYIIKEHLKTCDNKMQNLILKFLKLNCNYKTFLNTEEFYSFVKLIETFINLWKTNDYKFTNINLAKFSNLEKRILIFIFNIYQAYLLEKRSTQKLDFDDLIIIATSLIKNINLHFKYIIIDEFQDTSSIRLKLIEEIHKLTNSYLIVVGDDWQSIYRFSGCNLQLFIDFAKIFPHTKTIKLTNTYRNSMELVNIAKKFIQKNPYQIKKDLKTFKHHNHPIILVPTTTKIITFKKLLNHILEFSNKIMILARNNKDIYAYIDQDFTFNNNILTYQKQSFPYLTVHKAKGLEEDYIILLNCDNSFLGFPNKIENNALIDKTFPGDEIKYAEERRLFYVALTRCKEAIYILYDKENPSIFIKEIKKCIKSELGKITYLK